MALHLLDSASVRHVEVLPPPVGQRKSADSALHSRLFGWILGLGSIKQDNTFLVLVLPGLKCYDKARQGVALKVSKTFQMI